MDAIYTRQRHVYDATRKFYLLGRDGLIADLRPPSGGSVLEIACGTGRNLIAVARRYPGVHCHGLDISSAMLATAGQSIARSGLAARIALAEADAARFDPVAPVRPRAVRSRDDLLRALHDPDLARDAAPRPRRLAGARRLAAPRRFRRRIRVCRGPFNTALLAWLTKFHVAPRRDPAGGRGRGGAELRTGRRDAPALSRVRRHVGSQGQLNYDQTTRSAPLKHGQRIAAGDGDQRDIEVCARARWRTRSARRSRPACGRRMSPPSRPSRRSSGWL